MKTFKVGDVLIITSENGGTYEVIEVKENSYVLKNQRHYTAEFDKKLVEQEFKKLEN